LQHDRSDTYTVGDKCKNGVGGWRRGGRERVFEPERPIERHVGGDKAFLPAAGDFQILLDLRGKPSKQQSSQKRRSNR
jgi:hypothetical protein